MASILAGWLRDLDVMYFSAMNTSHWHWTTCLVKSLIHDACLIFVWAEELSRHTVVLCVCLNCSCLNVTFCLFRVAIFLPETLMQSFTVCVNLKSTQPSIPPGSVNEYQPRLGRQRQVWLIPIADWTCGSAGKTVRTLRTCHSWTLLRWCLTNRRYIKSIHLYLCLTL